MNLIRKYLLTFWHSQRPRQVLRKRSGRPSPPQWATDNFLQPPKTPTRTRPSTSGGTPNTRPSPFSFGSARSRHSSYTYSPPTPFSDRPNTSTGSPKKEPKRWTSFYHSNPPPNVDALRIAKESEKEEKETLKPYGRLMTSRSFRSIKGAAKDQDIQRPSRTPMTSRSFRSIKGAAKDQDRQKPKRRWSSGLRKLFLGDRPATH